MCGISGLVCFESARDATDVATCRQIVARMAQHQHARGPDHTGFWDDGRAFFGHNRLSILDVSEAGHQPMESPTWSLVFNGEIYNFRELRDRLESHGVQFRSTSDTEVLLQSLERFGVDATIAALNGIFAFAAWNKRERTLWLARDHLGIKPLFYYLDGERLAFASTPGAIAQGLARTWRGGSWSLNRKALYEYLHLGGVACEETLFDGIRRLDAATCLSFSPRGVRLRRYWRPQPRHDDLPALVHDAIRSQLVSDVPVMLFLSGGVDSSVIAGTAPELQAIHLLSPEVEQAQQVADSLGIDMKVVDPGVVDLDAVVRHFVESSGEPSMAGMIPYVVSREVVKHAKVALSANGADELFFGYYRTPTPHVPPERLAHFPFESRSFGPRDQLLNIFRHPDNFWVAGYVRPDEPAAWLDAQQSAYRMEGFDESAGYRWLELNTYIKYDLNPTLDFASMANSLEVRVPYLDYRVVEAALTLTDAEHIDAENGRKAILKRMLRAMRIPERAWQRQKLGFSLNPAVRATLEQRRQGAIQWLTDIGLGGSRCRSGFVAKDQDYLGTSAWAFRHWYDAWVGSGIVSVA